ADALGLPLATALPDGRADIPLVVARRNSELSDPELLVVPAARERGLSFVLEQGDGPPLADIFGHLTGTRGAINPSLALDAAHHPHSRLHKRTLS
ncbi:MAG TPA: hypothetical protein VG817_04875, partial [Gemmatimonadales bacterium]|nr:hypothetical protein [Gemmatimonadales bacterium]